MRSLRTWLLRLAGHFRKHDHEAELTAELESHVQLHVDEAMRNGMTPEQARRGALLKLGGIEQTKENYRDQRTFPWLESIVQDLRLGARMLRKNPGFTAVAVLILALGIGANSAVFSIVNAVMLRPLPYKDSQRLIALRSKYVMLPDFELYLAWPAVEKVRKQVSSFEQSTAYRQASRVFTGRGDPQVLEVADITDEFFDVFGMRPVLGRLLSDSDQDERNGKVVVLSEPLWRARFAADPKIVGQKINLDDDAYTIVGVAAKRSAYPEAVQAWTVLTVAPDLKVNPLSTAFILIGKAKKNASAEQLNAELRAISAQMLKEFPKLKDGFQLTGVPLLNNEVADARLGLLVLLGAATLVFLIACTNLSSMLLARGWARHQELAVRGALGASRGRLLQQMLVENCLIGFLGAALGIALALVSVPLFRLVAPPDTPRLMEIRPDWTMVAFASVSALITAVLFGSVPARHALRTAVYAKLKGGSGSRTIGADAGQSKMGAALVAAEVALVFVLLIGAGLMLQTLNRLLHQSPGFRTDNLLTFELYQPSVQSEAARAKSIAMRAEQTKDIIEQVRGLPGIESVAAINYALLDGTVGIHDGLRVEGSHVINEEKEFAVRARAVSPSYFQTLGLTLVRGRLFTDTDVQDSKLVVIVNEQMARKFWGTLDVVGKRFTSGPEKEGKQPWAEIIGVVTDAREFLVRNAAVEEYYAPLYQDGSNGVTLLVRAAGKPEALATTVTRQIYRMYPNLPITNSSTIQRVIEQSVGSERLHAALLSVFGGIGLLMALVGTYGVIAYAVERRTQEIGVRVALGASRRDVLILVCRHAFAPVLVGIAVGIPVALLAQRAIASELYGIKPTDALTFATCSLLMILVASVACWVPVRRALHVDPMVALRYE